MSVAQKLRILFESGVHRIGEIEIQSNVSNYPFILSHQVDTETTHQPDFGGLVIHEGPGDAREISTYAEDGGYRFLKGQVNLRRGWVMTLRNEQELCLAMDQFYPASVGLFLAQLDGTLEVETLREKLNRQTGMYRFARSITDADAQNLVQEVCGPGHRCAKKILWQIDAETPLEESETSRYNGISGDIPEAQAIPLLCREACNHFVAECRKVAKARHEANQQ